MNSGAPTNTSWRGLSRFWCFVCLNPFFHPLWRIFINVLLSDANAWLESLFDEECSRGLKLECQKQCQSVDLEEISSVGCSVEHHKVILQSGNESCVCSPSASWFHAQCACATLHYCIVYVCAILDALINNICTWIFSCVPWQSYKNTIGKSVRSIAKVCIRGQRGVARQMQDVRKKMEGCN